MPKKVTLFMPDIGSRELLAILKIVKGTTTILDMDKLHRYITRAILRELGRFSHASIWMKDIDGRFITPKSITGPQNADLMRALHPDGYRQRVDAGAAFHLLQRDAFERGGIGRAPFGLAGILLAVVDGVFQRLERRLGARIDHFGIQEHDDQGLVVNVRAFESIEGYLIARYHMYRLVYFHRAVRAAEAMLRAMFANAS